MAFTSAGCYAHARAEPAVFVEAEYEPLHVHTYPHVVYEGRHVYYVQGHWYTRDRGRWVYYRAEPDTLRRQRLVIQQAPPAPERRHQHRRRVRDHHDRDRDRDGRRHFSAPRARPH